MNAESEAIYMRSIDKIVEQMAPRISPELQIKISEIWKRNLHLNIMSSQVQAARPARKLKVHLVSNDENSKDDSDLSDDDFLLPQSSNICFGNLTRVLKKPNIWTVNLAGCIFKLENQSEYVFPRITALLRSDLF